MNPRLLQESDVESYLSGAIVGIVGNATSALEGRLGDEIDACDVVVRLNAGAPSRDQYAAIGSRTDVLMVGTIQALRASKPHLVRDPAQYWFVKPTLFGQRQWLAIRRGKSDVSPWWRYPPEEILRLGDEEIGSPASGGAVCINMARRYGAQVRLFGFTFFEGGTWWHTQRSEARMPVRRENRAKLASGWHPHDGVKERAWVERIGGVMDPRGWWVIDGAR